MAAITVICNQKGGVGKSTTAEALAEGLTRKKKKTLLIDLDPQGSITLTAGALQGAPTVYEVITKQANVSEAIRQRPGRTDIIPSSKNLASLDLELTAAGKEYRLKETLEPVIRMYDYIIIDTPPALGIITVNALTAACNAVIPAQADIYSLQGISQLTDTVDAIKTYTNPGLTLRCILLTRYNTRSILSRDMADTAKETAAKMGTFLYKTVIREGVALKEAQASQQPIYEYSPKSNTAKDYTAFVGEYIKHTKHVINSNNFDSITNPKNSDSVINSNRV